MVDKLLRCRNGREMLAERVLDCIENRLRPESEKWTVLIDAVRNLELVTKRGVTVDVLLEMLYDGVIERWCREADTDSFVYYREYLGAFRDRAQIKVDVHCERYRRLALLSQLQKTVPDFINEDLLIDPPQWNP